MRERGFTLVELVITTALLSSALLTFALIFVSITRLQVKTASARTAQQSGRYILEQMTRDIRSSAKITNPSPDCLTIIADTQFGGGQISYKYDAASATVWRNVNLSGVASCINRRPATPIAEPNTRITVIPPANAFKLITSSAAKPSVQIHFNVKQKESSLSAIDSFAYSYDVDSVITPREQ